MCGNDKGELIQVTPDGVVKKTISPPSSLSSDFQVEHVLWLEDALFVVIYSQKVDSSEDCPECLAFTVSIDKTTVRFSLLLLL